MLNKLIISLLILYAMTCVESGKKSEDLISCETDPESITDCGNVFYIEAIVSIVQQDIFRANEYFEKAIIYSKNDTFKASVYYLKGVSEVIYGRPEDALLSLNNACLLNMSNIIYMTEKANVLAVLGRYHEAIQLIDEVIELQPNNSEAYLAKGAYFYDMHSYYQSLKVLDVALALSKNNTYIYLYYGLALFNLAKFDESSEYFDKAFQLIKNLQIELTYRLPAKITIQDFKTSQKINFECDQSYSASNDCMLLGMIFSALENDLYAIKCYDKSLEAFSEHKLEILKLRGKSLLKLRRFDEAILNFDIALNEAHTKALKSMFYTYKGYCYENLKKIKRAIALYEKAIELDPKNIDAFERKEHLTVDRDEF